jgi:Uri superfamily endonuclease
MSRKKCGSSLKKLPATGVYTLVILLNRMSKLQVRKLGSFSFERGYYAYTGSGIGDAAVSLRGRVARHLRKSKTKHWHIDYLLSGEDAELIAVLAAQSNVNKECQVNNAIMTLEGATNPVVGFGASDCKKNCGSHLVRLADLNAVERIEQVYTEMFGRAKTVLLV